MKILLVIGILLFVPLYFVSAQEAELPGKIDNVTKTDERDLIKDKIVEKMTSQFKKDMAERQGERYTAEEYGIPYKLVFENNGRLIVGIDIEKAQEFNRVYSTDMVKTDLDITQDIDVKYYGFDREVDVKAGDALSKGGDSATITVVKNNKIITTGHLTGEGNLVSAGLVGGVGCEEVKITHNPYSAIQYADAAYGTDTDNPLCDYNYVNDVIYYNGKNFDVKYGTSSDVYYGKFIRILGIKTTSSGYILDADVTIKDKRGILNDQAVANYSSTKGDSGAPIFSIIGSSAVKLVGQHVGKACEVDLNSETNYGYWCMGNTQGLTIFSPWDQVAFNLGI